MDWLIKHLIKIDGEIFEIPLKVYNHLEKQKQRADRLENSINELKRDLQYLIDYALSLEDRHSAYDYQRVLDMLNDLEEDDTND